MIIPDWDHTATEPEVSELLAALVRVRAPTIVAEAGTYKGHSALLMADACRKNGIGHVYTFDPHDHGIEEYIDANRLEAWCSYYDMDFLEAPHDIDLAFIDASAEKDDGTTDASIREVHFESALSKLTPHGIIVVHDTTLDGVWRDGEAGASMHRIRAKCQINLDMKRGLSIFYNE